MSALRAQRQRPEAGPSLPCSRGKAETLGSYSGTFAGKFAVKTTLREFAKVPGTSEICSRCMPWASPRSTTRTLRAFGEKEGNQMAAVGLSSPPSPAADSQRMCLPEIDRSGQPCLAGWLGVRGTPLAYLSDGVMVDG